MSDQQRSNDDTKAAAFFTGVLTLAAGGAGFLVAGLVLGFDYLLHGQPHERPGVDQQRARNWQARYDDALAWIEADRADRARARMAKRDWFNADPDTRGAAPSTGETFGRALARVWNNVLVGATRFGRGWKAGRAEARQRREAGEPRWWMPTKPNRKPTEDPAPEATAPPETPTPPPSGPAAPVPPQPTPTDEPIDAEIVPDPATPATREVVPVGQNQPTTDGGPNVDQYAQRLEQLNGEVAATRNGRPADPSPPRTALQ